MDKPKILIVDDDESIRTQMKWALMEEYEVFLAEESEAAVRIIEKERPPLVTLDLGLPPCPDDKIEGLKLLGRILKTAPSTKVIVVSGNSERSAALEAISQGAHDFFSKPVNIDELKYILKRAYYVHTLEAENLQMQETLKKEGFNEMIGSSSRMQGIFATVRKVATTDVPVLITGESGTGKELIARAIHNQSPRKGKAMVAINCGAIPENLMESELFGHEKGAFTGAHAQRKGRFEMAEGGTLFLDEIGELPLLLQAKLLRFLQDHKIERVGGRESIELDVRVVAATNKDLKALISEKTFRDDLYFRLAVITIEVPPLRERKEDIPLLAKTFVHKHSKEGERKSLGYDAVTYLSGYDWPGNIRELENRIRGAVTLSDGPVISATDLGFTPSESVPQELNLRSAREELEKRFIKTALIKHNWNISRAAEELELSRPTMHQLIKKYSIEK